MNPRIGMHIGGRRVAGVGDAWFDTIDPFTGEAWAQVAKGDHRDVDAAVTAAAAAFEGGPWPELTATGRGHLLCRLGDLIVEHLDELVVAESRDNGKSYNELRTALRTMAGWYRYYGGLADKVHGDVIPVDKPDALNYTRHEPYGVVAAILPWNSPLRLASWKLAPALAAGNTVVVKPSEHTSTSIIRLIELVQEAGIPDGVINVVTGYGPDVVPALVEHRRVAKVSFTGGAVAGAVVAELAARRGKPATLELGGKSPHVVFADADLERAARGIAAGVFSSGGQTCLAGSRVIVDEAVHDELVDRVVAIADKIRFGAPSDPETDVGPVATDAQFERILGFIERARESGATLVSGGHPVEAAGCPRFVAPTVFTGVEPASELFQEEVFGPVLAVASFADEAQALTLANGVAYGLAAGVWTRDLTRAHRVSGRIQAGTVWVNGYRNTVPQSPFGGYKASGLGRESGSAAIHEYLQTKSVWIDLERGDATVSDIYELYALRYATNPRRRRVENLIWVAPDDPHDASMPMDFFVWAAVSPARVVLIDTGADEATCRSRGHDHLRCPADALGLIGVDPASIEHVVTTHLHWDHAGNLARFPAATLHVQRAEMAHASGPCMNSAFLRRPYDPDQIAEYLRRLYLGRVTFHEGADEIAPGISIHAVGGHTPGMQVVRVNTGRGQVVLASDAVHYYENFLAENPFPVLVSTIDYVAALRTVEQLAESRDHVIPGHDPSVLHRYAPPNPELGGTVARLDLEPTLVPA